MKRLYDEKTGTRLHETFTAGAILVLQPFREKQVAFVVVMLIPLIVSGVSWCSLKNLCDMDKPVQAKRRLFSITHF